MKTPTTLTNDLLVTQLSELATRATELEAQLVEHLASFIDRELHKQLGFRSPYAYLTTVLGFSRDAAQRRIRAAKAVLRRPEALEHLRNGLLTVSSLAAALPAIEIPGLLTFALGRSKRDVEQRVALLLAPERGRKPSMTSLERQLGPRIRGKLREAAALMAMRGAAPQPLEVIEAGLDGLLASLRGVAANAEQERPDDEAGEMMGSEADVVPAQAPHATPADAPIGSDGTEPAHQPGDIVAHVSQVVDDEGRARGTMAESARAEGHPPVLWVGLALGQNPANATNQPERQRRSEARDA